MADEFQRTVDIIFRGVDQVGPGVQQVSRSIDAATRNVTAIADPIAGVTKSLLLAETAILGVGLALTKVALDEVTKFNGAFQEISTLIDEPVDVIEDRLKPALLDYSRTSTQSLEAVTAATYSAISAGANWATVLDDISVAEKLAVAGNASLEESTVLLQQAVNAFGRDALTMEEAADALFASVKGGVTTIPELAANLGKVASTAAAAGVPIQDVVAAVATMTSAGQSSEQAFTSLTGVLTSFLKPSAQAADLAAQLGLDFGAAALSSRGLESVMQEIAVATGGNAEQMAVLFGNVRALNGANILATTNAEKFSDELERQRDNAGSVAEAFDRMAEGADRAAQRLANATRGALIDFAGPIEDEYADILDAVGKIFTELGAGFAAGGPLSSINGLLETFAGDLAEALGGIADAMPAALQELDLGPVTEGLEAIAEVFGGLDLTDPQELARVLQVLVDGFGTLQTFSASVLSFFRGLADILAPVASAIGSLDGDTAAFVGTVGALAVAIVPLGAALGTMTSALRGVVGLGGIVGGLLGSAGASALAGSATAITGIATAIGTLSFYITQLSGLDEILNDVLVPDWLGGEGATLGTAFADIAEAFGLFDDGADDLESAGGTVETALDKSGAAAETAAGQFDDAAEGLDSTKEAAEGAATAQGEVTDALEGSETAAGAMQTAIKAADDQIIQDAPKVQQAAQDNAEELKKQAEAAREFDLALAKLASEERQTFIEFEAKLEIAEAEANAAQFVATMESLSSTVESAGGNLVDLFNVTNNPEWDRFGFELQRAADQQREIQQRAADDQSELVQQQIRTWRAQEQAARRGDALITVQGDQLQPILYELMISLLGLTKIEASQQGLETLLGAQGL